ncbi:hypothetical protein M422DRAFT_45487 [Sphaerobolus stellatus SS14]|uniref:Uncharacterized protein n=1 Tax=Sphaerobolus stellatus (strain SS14) TaxID=990650 RepID=A0A0C9W4V1_SPHS4|nr:hypothetical protein M422DRAFT_45487 [Sphaerobolus stellatus SS14]
MSAARQEHCHTYLLILKAYPPFHSTPHRTELSMIVKAAGSDLAFNPEIIPNRKSRSIWKGLLCSLVTTGLIFGLLIGITTISKNVDPVVHPHRRLYATPDQITQPSQVVKPLIDETQIFDIAATVWIRDGTIIASSGTDVLEVEDERGAKDNSDSTVILEETNDFGNIFRKGRKDSVIPLPKEILLFSEVLFRGVTLKDKRVKKVNLEIPTSLFQSTNLSYYDLRAGFTLIPNSPSPLDYAVNYSSWIPSSVETPPLFPPEQSISLRERIINAYGINVPLLAFHPVKSFCTDSNGLDAMESENPEDDFGADAPSNRWVLNDFDGFNAYDVKIKKGESVLSKHPYVVTRSFIQVADFTHPLNRKQFNTEHTNLKSYSCGIGWGNAPRWQDCFRQGFKWVGNWENQIKLGIPDASKDGNRTTYVYAPYLHSVPNAYGPNDLVPIPVNREKCHAAQSEVADTITVPWSISYTGRSAAKMFLGESITKLNPVDPSATEREKALAQFEKEHTDAIYHGHWHNEEYHPRRAVVLASTYQIFFYAGRLAVLIYWYTRISTVGISRSGMLLTSSSSLIAYMAIIAREYKNKAILDATWEAFTEGLFFLPGTILTLRSVLRLEWRWVYGYIPALQRLPPSHKERASERLDARLSMRNKLLIISFVIGLYRVFSVEDWEVIPTIGIPPDDSNNSHWLSKVSDLISSPI